jgi:hypothetical protein
VATQGNFSRTLEREVVDDGVAEDSTTTATKFCFYTNRCQAAAKPKVFLFAVKRLYYHFESLY